jgi:hypothetical protein
MFFESSERDGGDGHGRRHWTLRERKTLSKKPTLRMARKVASFPAKMAGAVIRPNRRNCPGVAQRKNIPIQVTANLGMRKIRSIPAFTFT